MIDVLKEFKYDLIKAFLETLNMLSVSLLFTLIFGLIIGFILYITRKQGLYENKIIYNLFSVIINILRSVPFILFIIVLIPFNRLIIGTGFGVNASKIPLSLIGVATFSRLSEQSLLEVRTEMYETSYALGGSNLNYFKDILLKESRSSLILSFTSTIISLISYSTVMGIIGGGGLGYLAISEGYNNFNYKLMWIIIIIIIIIVQIVQFTGSFIANKLDHK